MAGETHTGSFDIADMRVALFDLRHQNVAEPVRPPALYSPGHQRVLPLEVGVPLLHCTGGVLPEIAMHPRSSHEFVCNLKWLSFRGIVFAAIKGKQAHTTKMLPKQSQGHGQGLSGGLLRIVALTSFFSQCLSDISRSAPWRSTFGRILTKLLLPFQLNVN